MHAVRRHKYNALSCLSTLVLGDIIRSNSVHYQVCEVHDSEFFQCAAISQRMMVEVVELSV